MPGHCRRLLRAALTSENYYPHLSWDYRTQLSTWEKKLIGAHAVTLTLPDNSEHFVATMMVTRNENDKDTEEFIKFVFKEFPGNQSPRDIKCNHFGDYKYVKVLHSVFMEGLEDADSDSEEYEYWRNGATLIYDLNHLLKHLNKNDRALFQKMYRRSRRQKSDQHWFKISDQCKRQLLRRTRCNPPIKPPNLNGRRCMRNNVTMTQRTITLAEQMFGTELRRGDRKADVRIS